MPNAEKLCVVLTPGLQLHDLAHDFARQGRKKSVENVRNVIGYGLLK